MAVLEAARRMGDEKIGDVVVIDDDYILGIVTDRDLVVRVLAEGHDPRQAVTLMREKAIRRLPVIEKAGRPVGIVSLGDLAQNKDPHSALGKISQSPPNN